MTTVVSPPPGNAASGTKVATWTHRSLWMLPVFLVVLLVTSFVGEYAMLPWLGLHEGDLMLMERGVAGWASEIAFALALAAPAVAGVVFAITALRHPGHGAAWVGLVLNGLLVAVVVYMFADAVHMTYFPKGNWLWF